MRAYVLSNLLLLAVAFCFATVLEPWHQSWEGGRTRAENVIQVALGDSRQLFARHFFLKADAYFHNGYYPTIYDKKEGYGGAHLAGDAHGSGGEGEDELNFLGEPRDWIDAFSRNLFPSRHTHLGDSGCGHSCCQRERSPDDGHDKDHSTGEGGDADHEHGEAGLAHEHCEHCEHGDGADSDPQDHDHDRGHQGRRAADEREILPWLKVALELDPKRVQTYVVAAFWLRTSLKQVDQAERLLRDGLRKVPGDPELLFELGRILLEERNDLPRARNVWEIALKNWTEREAGRENPNVFMLAQMLGNLATLEEKAGRKEAAIRYLERLSVVSPNKESIAKWIETLRNGKPIEP